MSDEITFEAWPKIARLNRQCIITEKLDGTNAAVIVMPDGTVGAQSRSRVITPAEDNYGFARWVYENSETLCRLLGPGRHFGEWWGSGVNRGYGLQKGDKRFSLFNVNRYAGLDFDELPNVALVPRLYTGPFSTGVVNMTVKNLARFGSFAVPSGAFMRPEGVIVFHVAAQTVFKVTCERDEAPKGQS